MTAEEKREELRERIESGEKRNDDRKQLADYARETRDNAVGFAKKHPVATVCSGLALGLVIGALTPKGRRLGRRAGGYAASLAELGALYASGLMDKAGDIAVAGKDRLEDLGDSAAASAKSARRRIGYDMGGAADTASAVRRSISRKTGRTMRGLRNRLTH